MSKQETHWQGNEFKPGEKGILINSVVDVIYWSKDFGGWWYIQLPNGGIHYTRLLKKVTINIVTE